MTWITLTQTISPIWQRSQKFNSSEKVGNSSIFYSSQWHCAVVKWLVEGFWSQPSWSQEIQQCMLIIHPQWRAGPEGRGKKRNTPWFFFGEWWLETTIIWSVETKSCTIVLRTDDSWILTGQSSRNVSENDIFVMVNVLHTLGDRYLKAQKSPQNGRIRAGG